MKKLLISLLLLLPLFSASCLAQLQTGRLNVKGINKRIYVDQFCNGSTDFGACWNNAKTFLPTISGQPAGIMDISGFAGSSTVTWTTPILINSPYLSIEGPGSGPLNLPCSINGDCLRIQISPFTVMQAGHLKGFTISCTGSAANGVALHMGDVIGMELNDLVLQNCNGTNGVNLWLDNETNWTERTQIHRVWLNNGTKNLRFSVGGSGNASFGYSRIQDLRLNTNANQVGISLENNASLYNSELHVIQNVSSASGTALQLLNAAAISSSFLNFTNECTGCTGGTLLNMSSTATLVFLGQIQDGGGLTTVTIPSGAVVAPLNGYLSHYFASFLNAGNSLLAGAGATSNSLGVGSWLINDQGGPGSFLEGVSNNVYFDGSNWRTSNDGVNNGGWAILGADNSNDIEFYVVPSTGSTNQSISNASFANNKVASIDKTGILHSQSISVTDSGQCTMSAGTCAAQTLSHTYAAAPKCFLTWTGAGALTGILKAPSTTTTVTPASSVGTDTAQVNWECHGS